MQCMYNKGPCPILTAIYRTRIFKRNLNREICNKVREFDPLRKKVQRVEQGILVVVKAPTLMIHGMCREE